MYDFFPDELGSSLKSEFSALLHGSHQDIPIGRAVILRRLTNDNCVCWNALTGSPNTLCKYCQGEGYYWREEEAIVYLPRNFATVLGGSTPIAQQGTLTAYGLSDSNRALAYCEPGIFTDYETYTVPTRRGTDKLYELKVDELGETLYSDNGLAIRTAKWKIVSVTPHHGEFGAIAYIELGLEKENL